MGGRGSGNTGHRSGPPPDPNALRRSRKSDPAWTKISAAGRQRPAPAWPLVDPTERELEVWERWWQHPVAVLWEEGHGIDTVAFVVRLFTEAEQPKARAEDRKTLVTQMGDLWLTPGAQLRSRILIVDESGETVTVDTPTADNVTDLRSRMNRADSA